MIDYWNSKNDSCEDDNSNSGFTKENNDEDEENIDYNFYYDNKPLSNETRSGLGQGCSE